MVPLGLALLFTAPGWLPTSHGLALTMIGGGGRPLSMAWAEAEAPDETPVGAHPAWAMR